MSKATITTAGVKAILLVAALCPAYLAVYTVLNSSAIVGAVFSLIAIVTLCHLYYGYKWGKYTVALLSLVFSVTQFFMFKSAVIDIKILLLGLLCVVLVINTLLLLRSKAVAEFLSEQHAKRSAKVLLTLKVARWALIAAVVIGLLKDLLQLAA